MRGIDALLRAGWKFVAGVIAYYCVRDGVICVIIPLMVAKRVL